MSDRDIRETVVRTLESVGLNNVYDRLPNELSGGMVKRAGFARAVVNDPRVRSRFKTADFAKVGK